MGLCVDVRHRVKLREFFCHTGLIINITSVHSISTHRCDWRIQYPCYRACARVCSLTIQDTYSTFYRQIFGCSGRSYCEALDLPTSRECFPNSRHKFDFIQIIGSCIEGIFVCGFHCNCKETLIKFEDN